MEKAVTYGDLLKEKLTFHHYDAVDVNGFHQDARDEISMDFTAFLLHMSAIIINQIEFMSQIEFGEIIDMKTKKKVYEEPSKKNPIGAGKYVPVLSGASFISHSMLSANIKLFLDWFLQQPIPKNTSGYVDDENYLDYFGMENMSNMWNKFAKITAEKRK